ncbi:MAG: TlpA family protein disulfide reductase [Methylococcales bacterium]
MNKKFKWLMLFQGAVFVVICCGASLVVAGQSEKLNPFVSGSLQQIVNSREGRPFLLVLWSPECASCRKELELLAAIRQKEPMIDIVMVATDEEADPEYLGRFLVENRLDDMESWYFSESNSKKLRYEVDSAWYGEIPRTYFYASDHQRVGISGLLKAEQIDAWLSMTSPE